MKIRIVIFIVTAIFFSCKRAKTHVTSPISIVEITENNKDIDTCIFDQSTQTDDFLKGIEELKGYVWDNKTKTATVKLSEEEKIEIYRGGCDVFAMSTTIIYDTKLQFSEEFVIQAIKRIIELLPNEYEEKLITQYLSTNKLVFIKEGENNYDANFMSQELYESINVLYKIKNNKAYISLDYYIN